MWTTEKINQLSNDIERGKTLKSLIRSISIDTILDTKSQDPIFPFYLPHKGEISSGLRAANVPFEFTEDEIKKYASCYHDPLGLYNIINSNPLSHEKSWISNYHNRRFNLNISPKLESAKLIAFCALDYLAFNRDEKIIIFDNTDEVIKSFMQEYKDTPFYLKPGIIEFHSQGVKFELLLDNGSKMIVTEYDKSKIYDADFIIISDLDKVNDPHSIALNFIPMLAKKEARMMICASTQNNILYNSDSFSIFEKLNIFEYLREINLDILI